MPGRGDVFTTVPVALPDQHARQAGGADAFIAFSWTGPGDRRRLVLVNYAGHRSQCYAGMPWSDLAGRVWRLADQMGPDVYERAGDDLAARGLYLDMPGWGYQVFAVSVA